MSLRNLTSGVENAVLLGGPMPEEAKNLMKSAYIPQYGRNPIFDYKVPINRTVIANA